MNTVYTSITYETLERARDRVLDDLNNLTDGKADKAIAYVKEFMELDKILEKNKKQSTY